MSGRFFSASIRLGGTDVREWERPYIVGEMSGNHNGRLENALDLLKVGKQAGVDAVKIQTFTADSMTIESEREEFLIKSGLWKGQSLYSLYRTASTPLDWHGELFALARELNLTLFSTPFDEGSLEFLENFDPPFYKIASFEAVDIPLVRAAARTGKPVIVSTGVTNDGEIENIIETFVDSGNNDLILLHCVSEYPTPVSQSNLGRIHHLRDRFSCMVGLSDHTEDCIVSACATGLGICLIEKHFTDDREAGGVDADFSLTGTELRNLCDTIPQVWQALQYTESPDEDRPGRFYMRSIYTVESVRKGEEFSERNLKRIRPGLGLEPVFWDRVIGSRATKDIGGGVPLTRADVESLTGDGD